jgi:translation initiation factor IF-3
MYPPRRNFPPRRPRIRENVNEAIRVREVRAVFPDGETTVMSTDEAIQRAKALGLDLILIAPTAEPPVAKAMDYGQWQYENKKKAHDARKKQHVILVKEIKFRPNTDDHDYDFKKNHAIRFLKEGNRVKAVVQFRGREIAHTDLGHKLLQRFCKDLDGIGQAEANPKQEGRNAHVLISPVKVVPPTKEAKEKAEKPPKPAAEPGAAVSVPAPTEPQPPTQ